MTDIQLISDFFIYKSYFLEDFMLVFNIDVVFANSSWYIILNAVQPNCKCKQLTQQYLPTLIDPNNQQDMEDGNKNYLYEGNLISIEWSGLWKFDLYRMIRVIEIWFE